VREAPAPAGRNRKTQSPHQYRAHQPGARTSAPPLRRGNAARLLETVPASIPIEFLIDPVSRIRRGWVLDSFPDRRSSIVSGTRPTTTTSEVNTTSQPDMTSSSVRRKLSRAVRVLRGASLWSCPRARVPAWGGPVVDDGTILPADLIAFLVSGQNPQTATQSIACLFQEMVRGQTIAEAMAAVRRLSILRTSMRFFNAGAPAIATALDRCASWTLCLPAVGSPAPRCPGGWNSPLSTLNAFAHWDHADYTACAGREWGATR